jgi:LAS superfamily LD-carboxypeptidase LdcB
VEPIVGQSTKTFEGKTWYLKKGMAMLATPGKSQHNLGIAVDVSTASGPRLAWMLANEHLYGFSHEVQSEPWHIRYTQGNQVPPAVAAFVAAKAV